MWSHTALFLRWALVMEEPWEAVATPVLETTRIAPLMLVPLILITLAGLWFGARQIVQPLRDLEKKSASLAWGDFSEIEEPVGGIAEIRQLQTELSHMAQKVQAAQRSLRDYIGAITDAQEEERRRLARELHDDTLQSIIALKQRVQVAKKTYQIKKRKNHYKNWKISPNRPLRTCAAPHAPCARSTLKTWGWSQRWKCLRKRQSLYQV